LRYPTVRFGGTGLCDRGERSLAWVAAGAVTPPFLHGD